MLRGLATAATLATALVAQPAGALSPRQLAAAIGLAAVQFEAITIGATSGVSLHSIEVIPDSHDPQSWGTAGEMADLGSSPGPFDGSLLVSTGKVRDGGLGDTDRGGDGRTDETSFGFTVTRPPPEAKDLVFTAQFTSGEFAARGWADHATGTTQVTGSNPIPTHATALAHVASRVDRFSPRVIRIVRVDSLSPSRPRRVTFSFSLVDGGDGHHDSALLLSRIYFTEKELVVLGHLAGPFSRIGSVFGPSRASTTRCRRWGAATPTSPCHDLSTHSTPAAG